MTSSVRAWLLAAAAPMTLASPAAALPSEPWSIAVEARECPGLDALRVRALFALELGRAAERLGDETVAVTCGPSETRLRIESSKMGWIERILKTSLDREEPERIVALAAAQLVLAAWVEAPKTDGAVASRAASLPAPESPKNPSAASTVSFDVELDAAVHARKVGAWAIGPAAGLSGTAWRGNWGASVGFDVDRYPIRS